MREAGAESFAADEGELEDAGNATVQVQLVAGILDVHPLATAQPNQSKQNQQRHSWELDGIASSLKGDLAFGARFHVGMGRIYSFEYRLRQAKNGHLISMVEVGSVFLLPLHCRTSLSLTVEEGE